MHVLDASSEVYKDITGLCYDSLNIVRVDKVNKVSKCIDDEIRCVY